MALTRATIKEILSKAGVTAENMDTAVDGILAGHTASVDALTELRDKYKADAEKLPDVQKKLDDAIKAAQGEGKDTYRVKYDALKDEFENYKSESAKKEIVAQKQEAYKALLSELKISPKVHDGILRIADMDKIELDNGKIKDVSELSESLKAEWGDFIITEGTKGADVTTPPSTGGQTDTSKMTDAEYFAYQREQKKG